MSTSPTPNPLASPAPALTAPPHADTSSSPLPDTPHHIELILRQVDNLPTLSPIATRLLEIANVEDADLDRIVEIIESDPALTARLLGLCRRADKGLGDRITTVRRAVVMLGLEAVQAAVLSVAVYELMQGCIADAAAIDIPPAAAALPFDRPGFWRHAIAVASASELIADAHADLGVRPEEAFVAGLIHDLGKLVLDLILPRTYARVLALADRRACSSAEAEMHLLGIDHHTAGKRLAEHWGLPPALQDVIWLHGHPIDSLPDSPHRNIIALVGVARALCRHLHLGWSGDFNYPEPLDGPNGLCAALGLDPRLLDASVARLHEAVAHRCNVLGLGELTAPDVLAAAVAAANRRLGRLTTLFEHRARLAQRQARVLQAISDFHAAARPGRSVVDTLAEVVRSASAMFGRGFFGVVYQLREDEPWRLCQFSPDGRPLRAEPIDTPPGRRDGGDARASLADLCNASALSMSAMSLLPWLADYLVDAADVRDVQLLPLGPAEGGYPAVVLLHDRDLSADRPTLAALTATWASAVSAAAQNETLRRMGERLASSNRLLAETQLNLAEVQSLARLGEMAAGAAHEMNNPLTVISGRAQLLASSRSSPADRAAADAIIQAADHLTDLITSLRLLADPPHPRPAPAPADDLIAAAVRAARHRTGGAGEVRTHIPTPAPVLHLDRELIATALAEVIANAIQAAPESPVQVRVQTAPPDGRLLIVVEDHGTGMSPRALQHAFDPFFSEQPAGRRTGLGLTRARRLLETHGGDIALHSSPGRGTTATLTIPPRAESLAAAA